MEVPLLLDDIPRRKPVFRLDAPVSDDSCSPEAFEQAVAAYAMQFRRSARFGSIWISGLSTLAQGRAALLAAQVPIWCTYRCDREGRTQAGVDVLAALIVLEGMGCAAFGLESLDGSEPAVLAEQYERLAPYACIPLLWPDESRQPGRRFLTGTALEDPDIIPCASGTEACFLTPDVDVGETLRCGPDLVAEILRCEGTHGALKIAILDEDDVFAFVEAQYAIRDALCIWTDVPEYLEKALRLYQGRAFWDGTVDLEGDFLDRMSARYGLIQL